MSLWQNDDKHYEQKNMSLWQTTTHDISTSKICLYDRTTTNIMSQKICLYDKQRHTLWDTCSNIVMRLQKIAFIYYQNRLSWKGQKTPKNLKKKYVPMPDKDFINQRDNPEIPLMVFCLLRWFQTFLVLGKILIFSGSNQLHKPIRGFSMCRQLALHRIVLPIYNSLKFKLASHPRI